MDSLLINKALGSLNLDRNKYADRALLQCVRRITPAIIETRGFDLIGKEVVELYLKVMRKRAHLHLGRNRSESLLYEQQTLECLINWIPNKDPDHEACAAILIELANGNQKKVEELVKELEVVLKNQFSRDQRIKATGPRPLSQINKLIYELVKNNPEITEKQLLGKLAYALHIIITLEEIEFNDRDADICETVKLSAMRCRLSRMKKVVNKEISH
jgi:hypothetical protein